MEVTIDPPLEEKMVDLADKRVADILDDKYSLDQLAEVSSLASHERVLARLEKVLTGKTEQKAGSILSDRQMFLLGVSFVVCMVGIANAMLMAITERFREIATMKCLGATDGFILI